MGMKPLTLEDYRHYVIDRLRALEPAFARASIGDFSSNVEIPDTDDEFMNLYVGVQIMLEVIRDQLAQVNSLNQSLRQQVASRTSALAEAQQLAHLGNW